jgi:hypothetical protein
MSKTLSIRGFGWLCAALLLAAAMPAHAQYWTPRVSEETPPQSCGPNNEDNLVLVSDIWCAGRYCDDMYLLCESPTTTGPGVAPGIPYRTIWKLPVSEEQGPSICPDNSYMSGIKCIGRYCGAIQIECTYTSGRTDNCQWSPQFSEEQGDTPRPSPNAYIHGIQCLGSNCDNIRVLWCTP